MPKTSRKSTKRCQAHEFSLKPCAQHLKRPQNLSLSLCTRHEERRPCPLEHSSDCLQAPIFNRDQNYGSPAFVLPSDSDFYRIRKDDIRREHDNAFLNFSDETESMNVPKPKSRSCYCSVCKVHYEDYLQHILSLAHKRKVAANTFSAHIEDLSISFQPKRNQQKGNHKPYHQAPYTHDDDSLTYLSSPHKKVKTSETVLDITPSLILKKTSTALPEPQANPAPVSPVAPSQLHFDFNYCMNYINALNYLNPFHPNYLYSMPQYQQAAFLELLQHSNLNCFSQAPQMQSMQPMQQMQPRAEVGLLLQK